MQTQDLAEEVRITTEGQRHLGTVTGSQEYKDQGWRENIELLAEIVKSQPHAAYVAFTKGYKSRFPYFMRTIDSFEDYVEPIDEAINDQGMIFSFQFFFATRSPSLMSCENYSPFRQHKGVWVYQTWEPVIIALHVAARLPKMNNAGQREWCKLVAQRRSPWRAGPDIELATI